MFNCHATSKAIQEACCVLVACTGGINHPINWLWFNVHQVVTVDDYRATLVACNSTELTIVAQLL
jgi:hypothetical protein